MLQYHTCVQYMWIHIIYIQLAAMLCGSRPPRTPKNTSFLGVTQPPGSRSSYILGDTTRPRHITYVLVWSKSDRRRLRKTLHKQADKPTDATKIMVTWPWTNSESKPQWNGPSETQPNLQTQKASDLVTDLCHEQLTLGHETRDQQQNKNSIVVTFQHTVIHFLLDY